MEKDRYDRDDLPEEPENEVEAPGTEDDDGSDDAVPTEEKPR